MTAPGGRPKLPVRCASPIMRAIFEEIDRRGLSDKGVGVIARIPQQYMSNYRRGVTEPKVMNVEEIADAIGMELVLRPKGEANGKSQAT